MSYSKQLSNDLVFEYYSLLFDVEQHYAIREILQNTIPLLFLFSDFLKMLTQAEH